MKLKFFEIVCLILFLLLTGCKSLQNEGGTDWATVSFSVDEAGQDRPYNASLGGDFRTALIIAVPANVTSVGITSYLTDLFDRRLQNQTDNSVSLSIPLNTPLRLAKVIFKEDLTLDAINASQPTAYCTGISEAFTVKGSEATKTVAIETGISLCEKSITLFKFEAARNSSLTNDIAGVIDENRHTISATVPFLVETGSLVATYTTTGATVTAASTSQVSGSSPNNFNGSVTYTVSAINGTTRDYAVSLTKNSLTQQAYIKAVNNDAGDLFGYPVSLSGNTLAVGAMYESSNQTTITNGSTTSTDNSSSMSGAVYVYTRSGATWSQQAYIKADNNGANDNLGFSVSLSGDTLAAGAPYEDSNQTTITNGTTASANDSSTDSGAVYIYTRSGSEWSQQAYIKAVNNEATEYFGQNLSLSGDTLAIGATRDDSNQTTITSTVSFNNSSPNSGAVHIYARSGTTWSQQAYVKASNNGANDYFGSKMSLSGNTLAVGVQGEDSNQTTITNGITPATSNDSNITSGAVYVYARSGTTWTQEAYIKAANNDPDDTFGVSVSLFDNTLAVGAYFESSNQTTITNGTTASADNNSLNSGAVYIYTRSGTNWTQEAYLKASNNDISDQFGYPVSLSGDTLAIGSRMEDSNQTSISTGAAASADNSNTDSGAVYLYTRNGTNWTQTAYLKAANNDISDEFGYSVSLSGDTLAVGAYYEDSNQNTITKGSSASDDNNSADSGAVYVYY